MGREFTVIYFNLIMFTDRMFTDSTEVKDIQKPTSQQDSGLLILIAVFFLGLKNAASLYTLS